MAVTPRAFNLSGNSPKQGLRTIELLKREPGPSTLAYNSWSEHRERSIALGGRPTWEIVSPSEIGEAPDIEGITVQRESIGRVAEGPGGLRFGTLVHRALRDSIRDAESVGQIVRGYGRILGSTEEKMEVAEQVVRNALSHPLLRRARSSPRCHGEFPIILHLDGSRTPKEFAIWHFWRAKRGMWSISKPTKMFRRAIVVSMSDRSSGMGTPY